MNVRWNFSLVLPMLMVAALFLTACGGPHVCAGLNHQTGSANSSRKVGKGSRGGYKSPRELEARDRSKKRNRNRSRQSMRKSRGGGNTTGKGKASFGGSINISGVFHIGGGGGGSSEAKH